jgi:hypothetical protein
VVTSRLPSSEFPELHHHQHHHCRHGSDLSGNGHPSWNILPGTNSENVTFKSDVFHRFLDIIYRVASKMCFFSHYCEDKKESCSVLILNPGPWRGESDVQNFFHTVTSGSTIDVGNNVPNVFIESPVSSESREYGDCHVSCNLSDGCRIFGISSVHPAPVERNGLLLRAKL